MNIESFLAGLIEQKIHIEAADGELSVKFPDGKINQETIREIRKRKQEILRYLEGLNIHKYKSIPKVKTSDSYAISDAQKRLYVSCQIDPDTSAYHLSDTVLLKAPFNRQNFDRAVLATVQRHESLRTVFSENSVGEIRQRIIPLEDLEFSIDFKDYQLDNPNADTPEEWIKSNVEVNITKAFDLEKGPLLRAILLKYAPDEYLFHYTMHHIISDGWSLDVLRRDVTAFYESFNENKSQQPEPLSIQYKDYAGWQLVQLNREKFKQDQSFWLEKLAGKLPLLDLPSSLSRPEIKTNLGQKIGTRFNAALTQQFIDYSHEKEGSLFITALAVFKVLLYRYTFEEDIIVGTPVAGRNHADLENQIGFYVNSLALRTTITPENSFNTFYTQLKENTFDSFKHQMYPFDRLVEELDIQRNTGRSAVFDLFFTLENRTTDLPQNNESQECPEPIIDYGKVSAKFDLEIILQKFNNYLSLKIVFNPTVYEKEMVQTLLRHYRQLFVALMTHPNEKISEIDFLSAAEKHELLSVFNGNQLGNLKVESEPGFKGSTEEDILDLFKRQVTNNPEAIAVMFQNHSLDKPDASEYQEITYSKLDERSSRLANYLAQNYDVSSGDFIAVLLGRNEWLPITILALLKLNAVYVPVDPHYPQERVSFMVQDSSSKLVVNKIVIEEFITVEEDFSSRVSDRNIRTNDLAYVIYTSGSTGTPKGVMIEHQSLRSFFKSCIEAFNLIPKRK